MHQTATECNVARAAGQPIHPTRVILSHPGQRQSPPDRGTSLECTRVKSLAKQLGAKGIRVNGVAPGPIWTPLQVSGGSSPAKLENLGSATALGAPGQPAERASIYLQLAASDVSFATGNIYGAGGGQGQPRASGLVEHQASPNDTGTSNQPIRYKCASTVTPVSVWPKGTAATSSPRR